MALMTSRQAACLYKIFRLALLEHWVAAALSPIGEPLPFKGVPFGRAVRAITSVSFDSSPTLIRPGATQLSLLSPSVSALLSGFATATMHSGQFRLFKLSTGSHGQPAEGL